MDKLVPICTGDYGFNSRTTMIKREHRCLLEEAQKKHWLCDFWAYVFYDVVYNRHTYQNEYYLLGNKSTTQKVDTYLYNALKKLQGKYEVACRRRTRKSKSGKKFIELNLGVNYMSSHSRKRQMTTYGELSIYIDDSYIFIRLLPGDSFCERYKIHLADVVHQNFSGCTGDVAHCIFNHELSLFGFNRIVFHKQFLLI